MAAADVFSRLAARVLSRFGEHALLRGEACRVDLAHGVEVQDEHGTAYLRTVATMLESLHARPDDELVILDGPGGLAVQAYVIDGPAHAKDGVMASYLVRKATI